MFDIIDQVSIGKFSSLPVYHYSLFHSRFPISPLCNMSKKDAQENKEIAAPGKPSQSRFKRSVEMMSTGMIQEGPLTSPTAQACMSAPRRDMFWPLPTSSAPAERAPANGTRRVGTGAAAPNGPTPVAEADRRKRSARMGGGRGQAFRYAGTHRAAMPQ